jgi:outer membrane protein assembly factor BamA
MSASLKLFTAPICCLLLLMVEAPQASDDQEKIVVIEFEGNNKTSRQVLVQEMEIRPGDPFNEEVLERSRQNIMDLGLFKTVEAISSKTTGGMKVLIVVDEKKFWYLIPVLSRGSDGDITYGVRLQMDNLFGLNNGLTVRAKRKDFQDTDIQIEETLEVEYYYPRFYGTTFDLRFVYDFDQADIEEQRGMLSGDYFRERESFGINLSKWITTKGPSKGKRVTLGIRADDYDHEFLGGDPDLFTDTTINSLIAGLEHIDVVDHGNFRSGLHYGLGLEKADKLLGSTTTRTSWSFFYRRYKPLNTKVSSNLNFQGRLGYISESIFGDATYKITGGTTIRGYLRDSIEGNSFYIANLEYLRAFPNKETIRGAAFVDVGDAFENPDDFSLDEPKFAVGVGLRWKIRLFVRTDLRLDIAQGLGSDGETRVYAGTNSTF